MDDERFCLRGFGVKFHQNEGVERIDRRHQKRLTVPIVWCFAQWPQRVVSPRITLVVMPRVQKLGFYTGDESPCMRVLARPVAPLRYKCGQECEQKSERHCSTFNFRCQGPAIFP